MQDQITASIPILYNNLGIMDKNWTRMDKMWEMEKKWTVIAPDVAMGLDLCNHF